MIAEKVFPSGAWRIYELRGDTLVSRVYYGFTKRESMREFRAEFPLVKKSKREIAERQALLREFQMEQARQEFSN